MLPSGDGAAAAGAAPDGVSACEPQPNTSADARRRRRMREDLRTLRSVEQFAGAPVRKNQQCEPEELRPQAGPEEEVGARRSRKSDSIWVRDSCFSSSMVRPSVAIG